MAEQEGRRRTFEILEVARRGDTASAFFDLFIFTLIAANVVAVVLESEPGVHARFAEAFRLFEIFSVAVFSVEYALRLWSVTVVPKHADPVLGRLRYAVTPMMLVDLVAILPFYLGFVVTLDLRFVRVFRLLRLFKLTRHSEALRLFARVLHSKRWELGLAFFVLGITLVFTSSLLYAIEGDAQPEDFGTIPRAMWWGAVTLATVGYGDAVPVTALGKAVAGVLIIAGIAVYALPVAVLASGFTDELAQYREEQRCPHCGKPVHEPPKR